MTSLSHRDDADAATEQLSDRTSCAHILAPLKSGSRLFNRLPIGPCNAVRSDEKLREHCTASADDEILIYDVEAVVGHVAHGIMALTEEQAIVSAAFLRHFMALVLFVMSCSLNVANSDGMYFLNTG